MIQKADLNFLFFFFFFFTFLRDSGGVPSTNSSSSSSTSSSIFLSIASSRSKSSRLDVLFVEERLGVVAEIVGLFAGKFEDC